MNKPKTKLELAIDRANKQLRSRHSSGLEISDTGRRWIRAVLVRATDLREIVRALESKL